MEELRFYVFNDYDSYYYSFAKTEDEAKAYILDHLNASDAEYDGEDLFLREAWAIKDGLVITS